MGDYRIILVGKAQDTDLTELLTGTIRDLRTGELNMEKTDWDRFTTFWDRVDKALAKKYSKGQENETEK